MILVSQDGKKAIDAKDILFYRIYTKDDGKNILMVEPSRENNETDYFGMLIMFEHQNISVVKKVMRFLARGIFFIPRGADEIIDIQIPTLYKFGMKQIEGEEIVDDKE